MRHRRMVAAFWLSYLVRFLFFLADFFFFALAAVVSYRRCTAGKVIHSRMDHT